MTRPRRLVLVVGTATDVGKTWVGGQVLTRLRTVGATVAARKPAQSADADDLGPSDADVLAAATGEAITEVCPPHRTYTVAMAPPMAAEVLALPPPSLTELLAELTWPSDTVDVGWLEAVGGVLSPIAVDADAIDLADVVGPDLVLLVADAGLGTINAVRLTLAALAGHPTVTFLNRYDDGADLHRRNRAWLHDHHGIDTVTDLDDLVSRVYPH
jgi:dethiobiotin synthetase